MRLEIEHRFDVPLREGFDYITDQRNWPEYWPGFVLIEPGSRWREPGDVTRMRVRLAGRAVPLEMTLRRFEPPHYVEYTTTQPGIPDARHQRVFAEADGRLHYSLAVELELNSVYERHVVRRAIARAMRRTLTNLDTVFCERRTFG
jgi:uncharacterized protein YndB with AHSA1/START domain